MAGNIKEKAVKNGLSYLVTFEYGYDEDNKKIRKSKTYRDKKEAEKALLEHNYNQSKNVKISLSTLTFIDVINQWMHNYVEINCEETTVNGYNNLIKNHIEPYFKKIKLQELQSIELQKYYTHLNKEKNLSPNTIGKHYALINTALKFAVKNNYIEINPNNCTPPKKKKFEPENVYNIEIAKKLIKCALGTKLESLIMLGLTLGLRREEICGLQWKNIDFENHVVDICEVMVYVNGKKILKTPKTYKSKRKLFIPLPLELSLRRQLARQKMLSETLEKDYTDSGFVYTNESGVPYKPNTVSEQFRIFLQKNNLPHIRLHDLRHSYASISLESGVAMFNLSESLGHSTMATTANVYSHLFDNTHKETVNMISDALFGKE